MGARAFPNGLATQEAIRATATRLFRDQGYEATTMRQLAREVGIEAASLYNHYPSKHELLAHILSDAMLALVADIRDGISAAGSDPGEQLRAAVTRYVLFHKEHLAEASITDTERRSLEPEEAAALLDLRHQLAELFREVIARGVRTGAFDVEDASVATLCVISMCARLPVWYRSEGRLSLEKVAELMAGMALNAVRHHR